MTLQCKTQADCFRELARENFTGIVEGKPVFVGDTLYFKDCVVPYSVNERSMLSIMSWNPPAPKKPALPEGFIPHDGGECPIDGDTVMVELSVKDATFCVREKQWILGRFSEACRKALEERNKK